MRARAIIFDLDGVLANTAQAHFIAWKRLADEIGVDFTERDNERLKGVSRMRSLDIILERSLEHYTLEKRAALADRKNIFYRETISHVTRNDLLPGALSVLQVSKSLGLKLSLASASRNAVTLIKNFRLEAYFDYIADANFIRRAKPDPEIFLTAAQGLGVAPHDCVGVEDAVAGISAIKAAGMYAVGIGRPEILKNADEVIAGIEMFAPQKYMA